MVDKPLPPLTLVLTLVLPKACAMAARIAATTRKRRTCLVIFREFGIRGKKAFSALTGGFLSSHCLYLYTNRPSRFLFGWWSQVVRKVVFLYNARSSIKLTWAAQNN